MWPDQDDTEVVFSYLPDGIVRVRDDLSEPIRTKAQKLFDLVGLGRCPVNEPRARDLRWRKRREAWRSAEFAWQLVKQGADIGLGDPVGEGSWLLLGMDDCIRRRSSDV